MDEESPKKASAVLLPEDYYFDEKGLMVFTETYHLKRGYCCENNCRHCPYRNKIKPA